MGDKVIAYSLAGMTLAEIVTHIEREHSGVQLNQKNVHRYLQKHSDLISKRKTDATNNDIMFTLDSIKKTLIETVGEIRMYLEKFDDNPKAVGTGLKLKLDAIEKMAKMLGGYAPDNQVNVQVNTLALATNALNARPIAERIKDYEAYYRMIETAEVAPNAPANH